MSKDNKMMGLKRMGLDSVDMKQYGYLGRFKNEKFLNQGHNRFEDRALGGLDSSQRRALGREEDLRRDSASVSSLSPEQMRQRLRLMGV